MERNDKVFFALNAFIWILVFAILFYFLNNTSSKSIELSSIFRTGEENMSEDILQNGESNTSLSNDYNKLFDDEGVSVLASSLAGSYQSKNGYEFYFGDNNYYAGFFDSENTSIDGGSYDLEILDDKVTLSIINPENTKMIEYVLLLNGPDNFILIYEPTGFEMKLEKV